MGSLQFPATLEARGPGTAVILDDDQVAAIGEGAKRFPVAATINGFTWRTTVVRMRGEFLLGLSKENREGARVQAGETVTIEVTLDTEPRTVDVPEALMTALNGDPRAQERFDALALTHRKEFARWVAEAKREETRVKRVAQALQMLHAGRTRS